MRQQRELFRISLQRNGRILYGNPIAACEIIDLTERGLQLKTDLTVEIGQTLQLEFELEPSSLIHCTILIARVSPPHVGARITDISPDDRERLSRFVEQFIALNLGAL